MQYRFIMAIQKQDQGGEERGKVSKWLSIFGQKYKNEIKGAQLIAYNSGAWACPHSSVTPQVGGPRGLPAVD